MILNEMNKMKTNGISTIGPPILIALVLGLVILLPQGKPFVKLKEF
jgi:hypothetical protein